MFQKLVPLAVIVSKILNFWVSSESVYHEEVLVFNFSRLVMTLIQSQLLNLALGLLTMEGVTGTLAQLIFPVLQWPWPTIKPRI